MIGTYLNVTGLLKMNKNNLAYQLDNYILKNISQPINVEMLCKEFHYQKTNFYKVTHELYGISIMKHVRNLKIQVAKIYYHLQISRSIKLLPKLEWMITITLPNYLSN